jgi:nitrite reductase/ring-hydroxylating ferredoxin subunit
MPDFKKALRRSDLAPGQVRTVEIGGQSVALFNVDGQFHALDNACPHRGGPLGDGDVSGKEVTCPWHAWGFDVTNGCGTTHPSSQAKSYAVKIEGEDVLVSL